MKQLLARQLSVSLLLQGQVITGYCSLPGSRGSLAKSDIAATLPPRLVQPRDKIVTYREEVVSLLDAPQDVRSIYKDLGWPTADQEVLYETIRLVIPEVRDGAKPKTTISPTHVLLTYRSLDRRKKKHRVTLDAFNRLKKLEKKKRRTEEAIDSLTKLIEHLEKSKKVHEVIVARMERLLPSNPGIRHNAASSSPLGRAQTTIEGAI